MIDDFVNNVFFHLLLFRLDAGKHEKRLLQKLFADYDPLERPVENESQSLEVKVGMAIQQVVDLDEKMQVLRSSGWMDYVS